MDQATRTFRPRVKAYFDLCGALLLLPALAVFTAIRTGDEGFWWITAATLVPPLVSFATLFRYRVTIEGQMVARSALWSGSKQVDMASIAKVDCIREQSSRRKPMLLNLYAAGQPKKPIMALRITSFCAQDREDIAYLIKPTLVPEEQ